MNQQFFQQWIHRSKNVAITLPINKNSINLLENLGFIYEKKVNPFEDGKELLLFAKTL